MTQRAPGRLGHALLWACCAILLSCSKPPAPAPVFVAPQVNPLSACHTTVFGDFVRGVRCPDVEVLLISRAPTPETLLFNAGGQLRAYGHQVEPRTLEINGQPTEALLYMVPGADGRMLVSGYVLGLTSPYRTDTLEVQCFTRGAMVLPTRCVSVIDGFIAQGLLRNEWPSVLSERSEGPATYDFLGRELRLPRDCEPLSPFDMECRIGRFRVHPIDAEALAKVRSNHLAITREPNIARERELWCRLDGVETECNVRELAMPLDLRYGFTAAVTVRDQPVLVSCETFLSKVDAPPGGLCVQFFWFDLIELQEPPADD